MRHHVSRVPTLTIGTMLILSVTLIAPVRASSTPQQPSTSQQQSNAAANRAATVDLGTLEKDPAKYMGKTVTVEGDIRRILGPNLFTIKDRRWTDLFREMPVVVPEPFAAIVRSKAPVRITGTVEKVPIAQIERRGGILTDPKVRVELEMKPALVAKEVHAMVPGTIAVDLLVNPETPVATSGSSQGPITDVSRLPKPTDQSAVGRHVNLMNVGVMAPTDRGFWIMTSNGERIFVMPATKTPVKAGQNANIQGVVLEMPEGLRVELKTSGEPVYIYADRVTTR